MLVVKVMTVAWLYNSGAYSNIVRTVRQLVTQVRQVPLIEKKKFTEKNAFIISILFKVLGCVSSFCTWLFVPTSRVMGKHWCGLMPARAVYSANLPTGMPMPHAPKSPSPRILSPSVTTMARTSGSGLVGNLETLAYYSKYTMFKLRKTEN